MAKLICEGVSLTAYQIRELTGEAELQGIWPLIKLLNQDLDEDCFRTRLSRMVEAGYRCAGAFGDSGCVGICGYWLITRFYCGTYMDIDNFVVQEALRGQGIGARLIAWLEAEARRLGCTSIMLDTYLHSYASHKFYTRNGFSILGFHMKKDLA